MSLATLQVEPCPVEVLHQLDYIEGAWDSPPLLVRGGLLICYINRSSRDYSKQLESAKYLPGGGKLCSSPSLISPLFPAAENFPGSCLRLLEVARGRAGRSCSSSPVAGS